MLQNLQVTSSHTNEWEDTNSTAAFPSRFPPSPRKRRLHDIVTSLYQKRPAKTDDPG